MKKKGVFTMEICPVVSTDREIQTKENGWSEGAAALAHTFNPIAQLQSGKNIRPGVLSTG